MEKAIFFDKDGVLNRDSALMDNLYDYELYPCAVETIAYAKKRGFKIFIVTNQPIVARGLISERELHSRLEKYRVCLIQENEYAQVDKIYFCPHHPNATMAEYRKLCDCRKPKPGMLYRAAREFKIDLTKSYLVGDRISDIIAGNVAGCKTVQCMTEEHTSSMIETDLIVAEADMKPQYQISEVGDLKEYL